MDKRKAKLKRRDWHYKGFSHKGTGQSCKWFKKAAHRSMRSRVRNLITSGNFELIPTRMREVSDKWDLS